MSVSDLIDRVLRAIHAEFYDGKDAREFARDKCALSKAIARYGYACEQRGWHLDAISISADLLKLLPLITRPTHQYLPRYLETCVDRHIGQKSEEIQARARALEPKLARVAAAARAATLPTGVVVKETTDTEILAAVYRDLANLRRRRKAAAKATPKLTQPSLL